MFDMIPPYIVNISEKRDGGALKTVLINHPIYNNFALNVLAFYGWEEMFTYLSNSPGADLRYSPEGRGNALQAAIGGGHLNMVRLILTRDPGIINEPNGNGYAALYQAVLFNQIDIVELLLANGANIHGMDKNHSSLVLARNRGGEMQERLEMANLLLQHGIEPALDTLDLLDQGDGRVVVADLLGVNIDMIQDSGMTEMAGMAFLLSTLFIWPAS
jgi:ankyrin repeat protein